MGVEIKVGSWKFFQKLISGGGDDYSIPESKNYQRICLVAVRDACLLVAWKGGET